jgi:GNAT superfamily N-acetyltransferase
VCEHARVGDLVIRTFTAQDQDEVAALILAGLAEHWGEVDESLNPDVDDLAGSYPEGRTIVVLDDDVVVGTGTVFPIGGGAAEITRMSVAPARRHRGIGRAVLVELVETARRWGAVRVVLETSAHWDEVIAFYRRCGFVLTHHHDGDHGRDAWFALEL